MNATELLDIISTSETSKVQFKREITHDDSMAAEIAAMSNAIGGIILLGVADKSGEIIGFDTRGNLNERIANIATNNVNPPVYVTTEIIAIDDENKSKVLVVHIPEGTNKPYKDNKGSIWLKQGSDKRRVTDNAEIMRLFQSSGTLYIDEMVIPDSSEADLKIETLQSYFDNDYNEEPIINSTLLKNLLILKNNKLTLAGLLFFSKHPQKFRPAFCIKAISFVGNNIEGSDYRSSKDIVGTIPEMFDRAMDFFNSNLHHQQKGQNFNSTGILEISIVALEEIMQNALIHRDYSKNAPIRIAIFDNRIEIISPGKLPNSLTVENIKVGNAVVRNNLLATFCAKVMKYRGFGSGIKRAIYHEPKMQLMNDIEGEQFTVIIPRSKN